MFGLQFSQELVVKSLVASESGAVRIEPTRKLRAYLEAAPWFRYGAFDLNSGKALQGTSPELADSLGIQNRILPQYVGFKLDVEADQKLRGMAVPIDTPLGPYLIAVCGWKVSWNDLAEDFLMFEKMALRGF